MEMISRRMIPGKVPTHSRDCVSGPHRALPAESVSASGKRSVPSYDSMMDIELVRLMEERYGIREEGLF